MVKKAYNDFCLKKGSMVYILQFYPRSNKTKTPVYIDERIDEVFNFNQFELYMRGFIEEQDIDNNQFKIKLTFKKPNESEKIITEQINSIDIVSDVIPDEKSLIVGTEVICSNGNYEHSNYQINENHVKWKGVIVEKINKKQFRVLFSINSVELRPAKTTPRNFGRPRYLQEKIINISDIRIIKKIPSCYIGSYTLGDRISSDSSSDPLNIDGNCGELDPLRILDFLSDDIVDNDDNSEFFQTVSLFARKVEGFLNKQTTEKIDTLKNNLGEKLKIYVDKNKIRVNIDKIILEKDYFEKYTSKFMRFIYYLNKQLN